MIYLPFMEYDWGQLWAMLIGAQLAALVLDFILGEPRRFHPLVGFGRLIHSLERSLNRGPIQRLKIHGVAAWFVAVVPLTACCALALWGILVISPYAFWATSILVLTLCIGHKSLGQHAQWVAEPMIRNDLKSARAKVSWLVSRNTKAMNATKINKACIESVLENGSDAIYGSLFWFFIAGAPGALAHRLANTLDASWGYRNKRYKDFGWWSARTDDWLNLVPARICSLAYSLSGNWRNALEGWRNVSLWRQNEGREVGSPNAGIVMSSGAGALCLSLGGSAVYDGVEVQNPVLGVGREPEAKDIYRSLWLVKRSLGLFILMQVICYLLFQIALLIIQ